MTSFVLPWGAKIGWPQIVRLVQNLPALDDLRGQGVGKSDPEMACSYRAVGAVMGTASGVKTVPARYRWSRLQFSSESMHQDFEVACH